MNAIPRCPRCGQRSWQFQRRTRFGSTYCSICVVLERERWTRREIERVLAEAERAKRRTSA